MTAADFRKIALSLEGVEEYSHAGLPVFRVGSRKFASLASQAEDYGNLMLTLEQQVWETIEKYARTAKATKTLSDRLQTLNCPYCDTANKVAAANCENCGAPLGQSQPVACGKCGNVMTSKTKFCSNCGNAL
jgi:membrane protease subunit (stomatin/prohibitin family)